MTITIETTPELEEQIEHAAAQAGLTPDVDIEANLLLKIHHSLAGIPWARYHTLVARRQAETLTPDEQQKLVALSDQIEAAHAQRMMYLTELARLRNISLPMLI